MDVTQIKEEYIIRNLHREARIMAQLRHPCIVNLYQTMQNGNVFYLVTELIGGGDLCSFIKSQKYGKLDERNARVYARQLISALAHMHNLGIVHRDLKMENVMINSIRTQIKIVDFGLSNSYDPGSPLRTHCGSPEYAAPELFVPGKSYGPEVDLWSLGVIFYGMVSGQLPFVAPHEEHVSSQERRKKLVMQINKGYSINQRKALSLLSSDFRSMIARMLIADALKRLTVNELLFHVWVTDKGKKAIVINPLKKLDEEWHISIMKQVGALLQLDWTTVRYAVNTEPHGEIAGMYNILLSKIQAQRLDGDGVTRTFPVQIITNYIVQCKENLENLPLLPVPKRRLERVASPTISKIQKGFAQSVPSPTQTASKRPQTAFKRPQTSVGPVKVKKEAEPKPKSKEQKRALTTEGRNRKHVESEIKHGMPEWYYPKQVGVIGQHPQPSKTASTPPNATRQVPIINAAAQIKRHQRSAPKARTQDATSSKQTATPQQPTVNKNEIQIVGSKGITKYLLRKRNEVRPAKLSPKANNPSNGENILLDKMKNKSITLMSPKPVTPAKDMSIIGVVRSSSDRKSSTAACQKNQQARNRRVVTCKPGPSVEKSPLGQGDGAKRRISSTPVNKQKSILNDPIAKSIVGYLTKTIPSHQDMRKLGKLKPPPAILR